VLFRKSIWLIAFFLLFSSIPARFALAVDVTLAVKTLNPTSLDTMTYWSNGVRVDVPGANATSPSALVLSNLAPGDHRMDTSFGASWFNIDAAGNVTSLDPTKMAVSGHNVTMLNTVDFAGGLVINGDRPTSVDYFKARLFTSYFGSNIDGGLKDVAGVSFPSGLNYAFYGMLPGTVFRLQTIFGDSSFALDNSGNLVLHNPAQNAGKYILAASSLTFQNTIDYTGGLTLNGVQATSIDNFRVRLFSHYWGQNVDGGYRDIPGASLGSGMNYAFYGILPGTRFRAQTSFGDTSFAIDDMGDLIDDAPSTNGGKYILGASTVTLQNTVSLSGGLTLRSEHPTSIDNVRFRLFTNNWGRDVDGGIKDVAGGGLVTGANYAFYGMLPDTEFRLQTSFGEVRFALDGGGGLVDHDPAFNYGRYVLGLSELVFQNSVEFAAGLLVRSAQPTSIDTVRLRLFTNFYGSQVDSGIRDISGASFQNGANYAFYGMLPGTSYRLQSSLGEVSLALDNAGNLVDNNPTSNGNKYILGADSVELQNLMDQRLRLTTITDVVTDPLLVDFRTLFFGSLIEQRWITAAELTAGVDFPMLGMMADTVFQTNQYGVTAYFQLLADGSADFTVANSPASQVTPTRGSVGLDNGANTLFLELLPANDAPVVTTGGNLTIQSQDQAYTTLMATATDGDGDGLTCRWLLAGDTVYGPAAVAGSDCSLPLANVAALGIGAHDFMIEVSDGIATVADNVVVTVENSPPVVAPTGGGVYEYGLDVTLGGSASDFDGDPLDVEWRQDTTVLALESGIGTMYGGSPVALSYQVINSAVLGLGTHTVTLAGSDGVNSEVAASVTVEIIDSLAPTIELIPSHTILWPPNHKMVSVSVQANVYDNAGGTIQLAVDVQSSEPQEFDGDGNFQPDHEVLSVDEANGLILLNLRAERSGKGAGRTYTIMVTATDGAGNQSTAMVEVQAPHSRKKQ